VYLRWTRPMYSIVYLRWACTLNRMGELVFKSDASILD
jgi:hypothetical protein